MLWIQNRQATLRFQIRIQNICEFFIQICSVKNYLLIVLEEGMVSVLATLSQITKSIFILRLQQDDVICYLQLV